MSIMETKGNQSVGKALKIIEILAESPDGRLTPEILESLARPYFFVYFSYRVLRNWVIYGIL